MEGNAHYEFKYIFRLAGIHIHHVFQVVFRDVPLVIIGIIKRKENVRHGAFTLLFGELLQEFLENLNSLCPFFSM